MILFVETKTSKKKKNVSVENMHNLSACVPFLIDPTANMHKRNNLIMPSLTAIISVWGVFLHVAGIST